ncbi:MAG: GatB/YqeY domain-containing protein [Omnitrophica bacterium]|nr:GatB/YqeY domain-containing protein [Candidatus Omnitrophota bacterium]
MNIREKIENNFKEALKRKEPLVVSVLRMVKAAIQNKEIEKKGKDLEEAEVIQIIAKQIQQHHDSIEQFTKGKREDLVKKETQELEVLKKYLPKQLSEEEVVNIVKKAIAEVQAKAQQDFGKVMKVVMAELKGKADGKLVSQMVNRLLNAGQ